MIYFGRESYVYAREMDPTARDAKPHAVCIPFPAQGHINAMLQLAKLLHFRGFHITFVLTEQIFNRILATCGPSSLEGLPEFRIETISDGLRSSDPTSGQELYPLISVVRNNLSEPFRRLLKRLNESDGPKVSCLVSDTILSFTLEIAAELRIPDVSFCSVSACGLWAFFAFKELAEQGILPLKSPLHLLCRQISNECVKSIGFDLWKKDSSCLEWLERKNQGSVLYVNFGSLAVMTNQQLVEFAWGLANSGHNFIWVIRPNIVTDVSAILPREFLSEISERGLLTSWCPQEEVLMHPSIGVFLTHNGWNSTMESIGSGIPMICWPYFGDQQTNCWYVCNEWGIGIQIIDDVKRDGVERLIRDVMEEEKGKEMRRMALKWKESAIMATEPDGKSSLNLDRVIKEVLLQKVNCI